MGDSEVLNSSDESRTIAHNVQLKISCTKNEGKCPLVRERELLCFSRKLTRFHNSQGDGQSVVPVTRAGYSFKRGTAVVPLMGRLLQAFGKGLR